MLLLIFYRFSCSVCNDIIILYKKMTKNKVKMRRRTLNLFASTKIILLCFIEQKG